MRPMFVFAFGAALGLAACQPAPAPVAPVAAPAVAPSGSMMSLINAQRAAQGVGPVSEDSRLSRAARAHAADMVANNYFDHVGLNGSRFTARAEAAGYSCAIAENLAFGQDTAAEVVEAWMQSSGHRRNMLLGAATEFGIGRVDDMWVLMMGRGC